MGEDKRLQTLDKTTINYRNSIRFGLYETVNNMLVAGSEKDNASLEKLKKIKVTAYKSLHQELSASVTEARHTIEIQYFNIDYMIEKTLIDNQVWKYDKDLKAWHLQSGLPKFE